MESTKEEEGASAEQQPLIIFDGGTGREIQRRGGPFRQPEWSALALCEDPAIVQEIHESYIEAGATAITTNTHAVVPFHLGQERYQRDGERLLKLAVDLAVQAKGDRDEVLVLGSIPPICGSYEPDSFDEAIAGPILKDFLEAF
jgi:S-methylmethionine-dependent homocysteine/selenocysteine methylase